MANTYKTPGVYIEEIPKFPPSVAQVETAIPAFIGYTEKAEEDAADDLLNVPLKISSMLEYGEYFGGASDLNITSVNLNASNQVVSLSLSDNNYMYESLRMFFANGGGECYIVSVGKHGETIQLGSTDGTASGFMVGLTALRKVDEPTLLLAPDAILMDQSDVNSLYQAMLMQCNDLQDRFSVFDLKESNGGNDFSDAVEDFRNGIGMSFLKYGAAYAPWIKAKLPRAVKYKDVKGKIFVNGTNVVLSSLISDPDAKALADRLDNLVDDREIIVNAVSTLKASFSNIDDRFLGLSTALDNSRSKPNLESLLEFYSEGIDIVRDTIDIGGSAIDIADKSVPAGDTKFLFDYLKSRLNAALDATVEEIARIVLDSDPDPEGLSSIISLSSTTGLTYDSSSVSENKYFQSGANNEEKISPHVPGILNLWPSIKFAVEVITNSSNSYVSTLEASAVEAIPTLKNAYTAISNELLTLPPSGAVVGVYARVDENRGVWKAPANESLNNVVGLKTLINDEEQEDLNIHTTAGKSINAIRAFTGKGTLIWGARTLAGNDNEWRYVSVRRFFNMVEESVKKSTSQFVFEPNDANTWIKVRAMIENFLTLQWRAGALQGAKQEDAYYVKVGLGQTMTAQDVLNGFMNVEIGMAVVRPAEFIILKFSHKLPES